MVTQNDNLIKRGVPLAENQLFFLLGVLGEGLSKDPVKVNLLAQYYRVDLNELKLILAGLI